MSSISCDDKGILCSQFTALSEKRACKPVDHISVAQIGWLCMNVMAAYEEGGSPEV